MPTFLVGGKATVHCHAHVEADSEQEAMAKFAAMDLMDTKWGDIEIVADYIDDEV